MTDNRAAAAPRGIDADIVALIKHFLRQAAVTRDDVVEQMRLRHQQRQASIDSAYAVQVRQPE